jgi:hypothetical protein
LTHALTLHIQNFRALNDHYSRAIHLCDCILHVIRAEADTAAGIFDQEGLEAELHRIKRGEFDASTPGVFVVCDITNLAICCYPLILKI